MRHFFVWPSALLERSVACAKAWKAKGYLTCVGLDGPPREWISDQAYDVIHCFESWSGYYKEINGLVREAFVRGKADLVTVGGDDQDPPEQGAECIADLYFTHFGRDGFGVLQGTGDMQGVDGSGRPASARVCGSPTFGRGWYERAYGGKGPFHDGYRSFYGDEDLWEVAKRLGVLWLEPNIKIDHKHWSFGRVTREEYHERASKNWEADQALFFQRKAKNFPGHEPLPPGAVSGRTDSVLPVPKGEEGLT